MSDRLTSRQRAHLRSLAHDSNPLIHVGKEGLTDAVLGAIEEAFNTRELLKIRVLDNAPQFARETGASIAEQVDGVRVVQVMGHTVVLYRPHPENPDIELPG